MGCHGAINSRCIGQIQNFRLDSLQAAQMRAAMALSTADAEKERKKMEVGWGWLPCYASRHQQRQQRFTLCFTCVRTTHGISKPNTPWGHMWVVQVCTSWARCHTGCAWRHSPRPPCPLLSHSQEEEAREGKLKSVRRKYPDSPVLLEVCHAA